MINVTVETIADHTDGERCGHKYGGIVEQCTKTATKDVTVVTDLGSIDISVCDIHVDKLNSLDI